MNKVGLYHDKFGFIPYRDIIEWDDGRVEPLDEYSQVAEWMQETAQSDGYLYPPLLARHEANWSDTGERAWEPIPGTHRPAQVFCMPPSHSIQLVGSCGSPDELRKGRAGFVIHFLGMLFGHRCQFWDWRVDGRISVRTWGDAIVPWGTPGGFLDRSFRRWTEWSKCNPPVARHSLCRRQRVLLNALFMHNRVSNYYWDWERFLVEYQVFDACCSVAARLKGKGCKAFGRTSKERWRAACGEFGLLNNRNLIGKIRKLRNDLAHETLWVGKQPTEFAEEGVHLPRFLANFNQRFFLAILGVESSFLGSDWATFHQNPLMPNGPETDG